MRGMVAAKRSRGNPIQRWEKDITYVWYEDTGKQSDGGQASVLQRHLGIDVLTTHTHMRTHTHTERRDITRKGEREREREKGIERERERERERGI